VTPCILTLPNTPVAGFPELYYPSELQRALPAAIVRERGGSHPFQVEVVGKLVFARREWVSFAKAPMKRIR